jgi:hypothetical protein
MRLSESILSSSVGQTLRRAAPRLICLVVSRLVFLLRPLNHADRGRACVLKRTCGFFPVVGTEWPAWVYQGGILSVVTSTQSPPTSMPVLGRDLFNPSSKTQAWQIACDER